MVGPERKWSGFGEQYCYRSKTTEEKNITKIVIDIMKLKNYNDN